MAVQTYANPTQFIDTQTLADYCQRNLSAWDREHGVSLQQVIHSCSQLRATAANQRVLFRICSKTRRNSTSTTYTHFVVVCGTMLCAAVNVFWATSVSLAARL